MNSRKQQAPIATMQRQADGLTPYTSFMQTNGYLVHHQAIIDATTHAVVGAESLIRRDFNGYTAYPDEILQYTAGIVDNCENSFIKLRVRIDQFVAEKTLIVAKLWPSLKIFSFNASSISLIQEAFIDHLVNLADSDALPDNLTLEVTESDRIADHDYLTLSHNVERLKQAGYSIAIDDYDHGYATPTLFSILEPKYVKFGHNLIAHLDNNHPRMEFTQKAFLSIAQSLAGHGVDLIIEGIERPCHLALIEEIQPTFLQGYHFHKPEAYADFQQKLIQPVLA